LTNEHQSVIDTQVSAEYILLRTGLFWFSFRLH